MADKTFDKALIERISQVAGSDVFASLYHPSMADFRKDPWPAIELTIAILLDKPIVIGVMPGRKAPAKLEAIADLVIEGGPEEIAAGIAEFLHRDDA